MGTATRKTSVIWLFLFSSTGVSFESRAQDLFDPVWATMTQDHDIDSPGCRGCHIAEVPTYGDWFGNTQEDVRDFFLNGPGMDLVAGGRNSRLAEALGLIDGLDPFMPFGAPFEARFWADDPNLGLTELTDLGNW